MVGGSRLPNGLQLERVTVPLGVVAMVYEARPNVTSDAAGLCLKAGDACVLRGGSLALRSNVAIAKALVEGVRDAPRPPAGAIQLLESPGHEVVDELMGLTDLIDVLIPRGGAGLIRRCVENSRVPVIETGTGNCHVYVHARADLAMALEIILNAKTQRPGVCNACESVIVDQAIAERFLPDVLSALSQAGVLVHADEQALACARALGMGQDAAVAAARRSWGRRVPRPGAEPARGGGPRRGDRPRQPLRDPPLRVHRDRGLPGGARSS